jgi:hypothetical protein
VQRCRAANSAFGATPQKVDSNDTTLTRSARIVDHMSYTVTLGCGCHVYVACHPRNGVAHTRIIEYRAPGCRVRSHDVGVRVPLWELLPYEPDETSIGDRPVRRSRRTLESAHS